MIPSQTGTRSIHNTRLSLTAVCPLLWKIRSGCQRKWLGEGGQEILDSLQTSGLLVKQLRSLLLFGGAVCSLGAQVKLAVRMIGSSSLFKKKTRFIISDMY
jgi:hypothetical protein